MPPQDAFSHDQAVKNLIKDYPVEALEFLASDVITTYGPPISVEFLDPSVTKDDTAEPGPGQAMDIAIRYGFANGASVLVVLVEHWSSADRLDLLRTARYYLDLCRRFPENEILPIALVDDDRPRELQDTVVRCALNNEHLRFRTRIIQVPALSLEAFRHTANRVALSFSPNMSGSFDRAEQVFQVAVEFRSRGDLAGARKFFAFWVVEGRLNLQEQRKLKHKLKERDMPEIIEWLRQEGIELGRAEGLELGKAEGRAIGIAEGKVVGIAEGKAEGKAEGRAEGIREKAIEDARKLREHGVSWEIITSATGVSPQEIET